MVRQYPVQEAVIISFHTQHHKLNTNCAVRMTHLWPRLQNSNSSWYWGHCTIVLHLLHVQFVVVGWFSEQSWWGARWCRCPIYAPPWITENIQLATWWWQLPCPYKKHCVIQTPTTTTGRTYRICDEDYDKTVAAFAKLHSWKAVHLML